MVKTHNKHLQTTPLQVLLEARLKRGGAADIVSAGIAVLRERITQLGQLLRSRHVTAEVWCKVHFGSVSVCQVCGLTELVAANNHLTSS